MAMRLRKLFFALVACACFQVGSMRAISQLSRNIEITNKSGHKMHIYWINPMTGEEILTNSDGMLNGASLRLDSFVNHTFLIRETPSGQTDTCGGTSSKDDSCHIAYMTVSDSSEQVFHVKQGLKVEKQDTATTTFVESKSIISRCKGPTKIDLQNGKITVEEAVDKLISCVTTDVASKLEAAAEEVSHQAKVRIDIANQLEYYTCAGDLPTSEPIEQRTWYHESEDSALTVNVLHEHGASKIHAMSNFITQDECDAIQKAAEPHLHKATTADGKGGSTYNPNRKAMQAGVPIPWNKEADGDLIARVSRRLYDYTNHATGYNLNVTGQEDIMSIQYFGRGENDTAPDQYKPHCDGDCGGLKHKRGGRVATMVMYCDVPERGGSTNFKNAGVTVKPKLGSAVFFSYLGEDGKMDNQFTEHSGCPVIEGRKHIAVQWMRLGVDVDNPWDSFNTLTVQMGDEDQLFVII